VFGVGVSCLPPLLPPGNMHSLPVSFPVRLRSLLRATTHFHCVCFGYRSFSWWSCLPLGPGRKSPRYIYRYLLVCDHWPTASSCGSLAPPLLRQNGVIRGLWAAYGFGWDFPSLSFVRFLYFPWLFTVGVGSFSYGLHVCGGFLLRCIQACTVFCSFYP